MTDRIHKILKHATRAIFLTIVFLYFLIDLIFFSIIRPLRWRMLALASVARLRDWVGGLNRYAALLLLLVPWLILEPMKPIGFVLFAHKHQVAAILLIVGSEVVKLTLFEQLFDFAKPKLMSFRWVAWSYFKWHLAIVYLHSLPAWRSMVSLTGLIWAPVRRRWLISSGGKGWWIAAGRFRRDAVGGGDSEDQTVGTDCDASAFVTEAPTDARPALVQA